MRFSWEILGWAMLHFRAVPSTRHHPSLMPMRLSHKEAKCHSQCLKLSGSPPELLQRKVWIRAVPHGSESTTALQSGHRKLFSVMLHWPGDKNRIMESLRLE